jgi:hypothetical protein
MMMMLLGIYLFVYVAFNGLRLKCFLWFLLGMMKKKKSFYSMCGKIFQGSVTFLSDKWMAKKKKKKNEIKISSPSAFFPRFTFAVFYPLHLVSCALHIQSIQCLSTEFNLYNESTYIWSHCISILDYVNGVEHNQILLVRLTLNTGKMKITFYPLLFQHFRLVHF